MWAPRISRALLRSAGAGHSTQLPVTTPVPGPAATDPPCTIASTPAPAAAAGTIR
ncbi:hypothetical protein ACN27G_05915 [Plantactinospora sp. WMMB334]|uniref:hypothetical protein n=1 Tax=Plantactinospora sp. WMMB334 TaxID=3404119 RepID=UPI003B945B5C